MKTKVRAFFVVTLFLASCSKSDDNSRIDCSGFSIEVDNHTSNYNAWVNQTGGEHPITYQWSNGETTQIIGGDGTLEVGTYSVTVTDARGCTLTGSITIEHQAVVIENSIECVGSNSVIVSVNVTDGGESEITEKGVCYSLSNNPTIVDSTIVFPEVHSSSVTIESLALGTTYYARGYVINSAGVSYGEELTFTTNAKPSPFTIGQQYQGGIIAHINCDGTSGYILNTDVYFDTNTWVQANSYCENLISNGYDDWYLPNINQLYYMYQDLHQTGIFEFDTGNTIYDNYWSSPSFYNSDVCGGKEAYYLDFDNGNGEILSICYHLNFLPIRNF